MAGNSADQGRSVTAKLAAILTEFNRGSCYHLSDLARHAELPMLDRAPARLRADRPRVAHP